MFENLYLKDIAGPVATVLAAGAAAFVAYRLGKSQVRVAEIQAEIAERNWKSENEKIVLDLFERRIAIYESIRAIVGEIVREGIAPNDHYIRYCQSIDRVAYFFGVEVQTYLEALRHTIIDLNLANTMMKDETNSERSMWIQKRRDYFQDITKFYKDAPDLFGPYIKAHQKVI